MKETLTLLWNWGPIFLLLVLAVLGIILSLAGSTSKEERLLNGQDDEHYVLRQPLSRLVRPLVFLAIGIALEVIFTILQRFLTEPTWLAPVIKLAAAVLFGIVFWVELAKVVRQRVFVNGDKLLVTPAMGAPIETNFSQIRTVANKVVGSEGGVVGKKIKTKEGKRFEVINTMAGYEQFCAQLDAKVELPNLTKKLFKKKRGDEEIEVFAAENMPGPAPDAPAAWDGVEQPIENPIPVEANETANGE